MEIKISDEKVKELCEQAIKDYVYNSLKEMVREDQSNSWGYINEHIDDRTELGKLFKNELRYITRDLKETISKELRQEYKQEIIDKTVEKISKLDKKEVIKALLKED